LSAEHRRADGLHRVVVTGIGVVSPLGIGAEVAWTAALAGTSTAGPITQFDTTGFEVTFACEVPGFEPSDFIEHRAARRMERFSQLGVAAARLAVEDASLPIDGNTDRIGVMVGSGVGGLDIFTKQAIVLNERGPDRVSPLFVPSMIANMAAAHVSMQLGLRGPLACATTACAAGNHSLGEATDQIRLGRADVMLAGGAEAAVTPIGIASFNSMKALSTRVDSPQTASRPFDTGRDGFVMGEAGAVLVLESLEHALGRGANIVCEVAGYGLSGDAHHITEPDPTGAGPARAMTMALNDAGVGPDEVDYVNAHGTSTPVGDRSEVRVVGIALGAEKAAKTPVSSTKSMHGHCLGAAGGLEGALTAMAIRDQRLPPTINLADLDPDCAGVDHVANVSRAADVRVAVSNAFGFGGHNATICLTRFEA
jgi:3-oxoacyl-[acyl-carrier-protein] synthase II